MTNVTTLPNAARPQAKMQTEDLAKLPPEERDAIYNHFKAMDVVQSIAYLAVHCGHEYAQSVIDEAQALLLGRGK